jgi:hypothetical protein
MAKTRELEQCAAAEEDRRDTARNALIGMNVLDGVGKPSDLLQVQVRPLWDRRYRVNIFVGPDVASARVANSYFLEADEDGTVIASTPTITRQYHPPVEKKIPTSPACPTAVG